MNHFEQRFKEIVKKDFNDYYKVYYPKLLWHVQNIIQDQDDSHDIADMAFIKSLKSIEMYNPKYAFSTWLFTIASKMSLQYMKDRKRLVSLDQESSSEGGSPMGERLAVEDSIQPEIDQRFKMKAAVIMEMLEDLDPRYQRVLRMRELNGMAYQDIATELNMNLSTVKNHIRSGRQLLMARSTKAFKLIEENY